MINYYDYHNTYVYLTIFELLRQRRQGSAPVSPHSALMAVPRSPLATRAQKPTMMIVIVIIL